MAASSTNAPTLPSASVATKTAWTVLAGISFCHMLNDLMQSLIPALYPVLKQQFQLDFGQIGLLALSFNATASLLQPVVGFYTDKRPQPFSLAFGMTFTLAGLLLVSVAPTFATLLAAAALVGLGSAVFHPESSRVARLASGGQHGLAQSFFQVGGNVGSSIGPLLAAFIVVPRGQRSVGLFSLAALAAIVILTGIGRWYRRGLALRRSGPKKQGGATSSHRAGFAISILLALIFSKYFYLTSLTSYYTFYLIHKFGVSVQSAQLYLFVFLGAVALGTFVGGPVGDRIGRKYVIWCSILGVFPFSVLLPYVNLFWTSVLSVIIGIILASAFSAILVYAQELLPGRVGMVSGLFFGFAFGMGGIGAAVLGQLADRTSIEFVYKVCSFLPLIGLLTALLPNVKQEQAAV